MNLLALALAPVVILLVYIYSRDVIAKEPIKMLLKAFFGGVLSAVITIIVVGLFAIPMSIEQVGFFMAIFNESFLQAGIPEELFKYLILFWLVWSNKEFDERFDGIVYAVFVSMGFAGTENIFYVLEGGTATAILRAFTAVPGHFFFAVIMGYYLSKAKFVDNGKYGTLAKALIYPMIAHGTYDFCCFSVAATVDDESKIGIAGAMTLAFFVFNFFLWRYGIKKIRELRKEDLQIKAELDQGGQLPLNHSGKDDDLGNDW